ncbi:S8 family peptidase [Actinokineospora fastidiosa]|uniref:Serine protease n=1 Tax=Actinokineospora fastidiosa TaxID=1816 RepID=A0A918G5A9_9PSEU|nr:S8 family peptidase [Actinokineospora fastidiosa]GGS20229.1 serine protease [Actinokineospora fastidiosa]
MKLTTLRGAATRAAVLLGAAATGIAVLSVPAAAEGTILGAGAPGAAKDRYIVKLKDNPGALQTTSADKARRYGGAVRHRLDVINGFSVTMTEQQARRLAADPDVEYVQQAVQMAAVDTQTNPPNWGDDRIDQRDLPLNGAYTYPTNAGQGAHVYVLDTGINAGHSDFTGRIAAGYDFVDGDSNPSDCQGHGTHVAGSAAGTRYGVAKKATIHAVRVLDCQGSGSSDDIIAGINWVKNNAVKPAVVNYSIGCRQRCTDPATDNAVKALIASGVQFVMAAGNSTDDACGYSPQYVTEGVTVGNSTRTDARSSSSNYGSCLDIWAPGTDIVSASHTSSTGTATMTGTSMASPHVAGAAAVYLAQNPGATPAQVRDALVTNASTNKLSGIGTGSPNRLLYTAFMNGGSPDPDPDPEPTGCSGTNGANHTINDNATVESSIAIASTCGTASSSATVTVGIVHTYIGDLVVSLIAPDGSAYTLHNRTGSSADNINQTYTVNLSSETAAGTWKLRVQDVATNDTGYLDTWTLDTKATTGGGTPGTCAPATNGTNVTIYDNATAESPISLSCSGTASATSKVDVSIQHTFRGDLVIDLVAPDGTAYRLKNSSTSDSADNVIGTATVNLSSESRAGTWKLRVQDIATNDTGYIDSWTLTT